jgi:hypothetical protein
MQTNILKKYTKILYRLNALLLRGLCSLLTVFASNLADYAD